jgi:hypothetical protein
MRKILAILTTVFALTFLCAAQTGGSSGSQGASSDQTKATDQGAHKSMTKGGGGATLTGCLSGPNSEGVYTIKHGRREVEVGGLDDLSKHVGHEVKLHGSWAKSGSAIGEKEEAGTKESKEEKGERHFKVSSIDHISDTCNASASSGHHKKGSSSGSSGTSQPSTPPK